MSGPQDQPPTTASADVDSRMRNVVDRAAQKYLQSKKSAGLAVGVVVEDNTHSFFFGPGNEAPPNEETIFEIGSITKVFAAVLLADMHLNGEVDLNDPVNKYLPDSAQLPGRGGVDVTLRHLATHTSGLPRLPNNLDLKNADFTNPYAHYTEEKLFAGIANCRLESTPGTRSTYSNFGYGLLGIVLAKIAGTDFETVVTQRICAPLDMTDTTIVLSSDQQRLLAAGHAGGKPAANWDLASLAAAGALRSNLRDMLRFLRANLDPSSTSLEQTIRYTHEIQIERHYRVYRDFGCMAPIATGALAGLFVWQPFGMPAWARIAIVLAMPGIMFRFWPTGIDTMGLGWHVDDMLGDTPALWHNGGTGGYASYMGFMEKARRGVVLLANSDREPDPIGRKLLQGLAAGSVEK